MKVEIKETGKVKEREFPKLMSTESGKVVLMFDSTGKRGDGTGVLLNESGLELGHYGDNCAMENFSDFEGSITLSND